jgi:hypothetical protein
MLLVSVTVEGWEDVDTSPVTAGLREIFEIEDFVICGEKDISLESGDDLFFEAAFDFRFKKLEDRLVPRESGVVLYRGECTIVVFEGENEISRTSLHSKATSGKDEKEIKSRIVNDLTGRAARAAGVLLEPVID